MGHVFAEIELSNPRQSDLTPIKTNALADTGALMLCIPQHIANQLKLEAGSMREVSVADGRSANVPNAEIAIKQKFGFAKNQRISSHTLIKGIINHCVDIGISRIGKVNDLTLKEYVARIDKIKRSVNRHSDYGVRGYYDFIKNYV